ncbi:hypothetical protein [Streptomyces lienomycini]|uniref:hypothetical protein n=1 Tax=Streptomyces lienomycini TaxID=284035 RepID=UPI0022FDD18B|nr:hypothetical protein [Streptomyces lienomycini]
MSEAGRLEPGARPAWEAPTGPTARPRLPGGATAHGGGDGDGDATATAAVDGMGTVGSPPRRGHTTAHSQGGTRLPRVGAAHGCPRRGEHG